MEVQFIEREELQIYSVYHEPDVFVNSDKGIVLCHPLGQEYIRCYVLYINLANALASLGYHVLRFDYIGTGDSSCSFEDVSLIGCLKDIDRAVTELRASCGVTRISLFGVRLGATLSFLYTQIHEIDKLILWSPVLNGQEYLNEIVDSYSKWLSGSFTYEDNSNHHGVISFGFLYPSNLEKELRALNLNFDECMPMQATFLIDEQYPFQNVNDYVTFEETLNKKFWIKDGQEKCLVPRVELDLILDWLKRNEK